MLWWAAKRDSGRLLPSTPMNVTVAVLLGMVGVSLFATFDIGVSLGKVSGVLLGVLLFWAVARFTVTTGRLRLCVGAFVAAGAGLAIIGLLGTSGSAKMPWLGQISVRLPWLIRDIPGAEQGFNANAVAGSLALFLPLQIALLAAGASRSLWPHPDARRRRIVVTLIQALVLLVTAVGLLVMQSRGAFLGLLCATVAFLCWHGRRTRMAALTVVGVAIIATTAFGPERVYDLVSNQADSAGRTWSGLAGTVSTREQLWARGILGIQDFPVTGMGMNVFRSLVPIRYPILDAPLGTDVVHAHNHLLQAGLDLGIIGLVAYSSLWLLAATLLYEVYRGADDRTYRAMAGGLGAGLIAHFVFNMTDVIPLGSKVGVFFWVTLALVVSVHRLAQPPRASPCQ
jgi:O-antigen ligase